MKYHVAVVDDDAQNLANAKSLLTENGMKVTCLNSGRDLLKFIKKKTPDLILLDVMMPQMDGFETLSALRSYEEENGTGNVPVIFLTGDSDAGTEQRGLMAGASDFVCKPFNRDILVRRIKNTVTYSKTIETLTQEATTDRLTGFLNKAGGTAKVSSLCAAKTGVLMILDLDNFKLVNDLYGHDMGDKVLMAFARIVRENTRKEDVACRIGGDEFLTFLPGDMDKDAVSALTKKLNENLLSEAKELMGEGFDIPLGISVGAVMVPDMGRDYGTLFSYADASLYKVKKNGKHGFEIYDPSFVTGEKSDDIEADFSRLIRIVEERNIGDSAQILSKDAFTASYRYIVRSLKRYNRGAVRLLFSLSVGEGGEDLAQKAAVFGQILQKNLRKSDIILHDKTDQFFVLLPELSEEAAEGVIARIIKLSKKNEKCGNMEVNFVIDSISF